MRSLDKDNPSMNEGRRQQGKAPGPGKLLKPHDGTVDWLLIRISFD